MEQRTNLFVSFWLCLLLWAMVAGCGQKAQTPVSDPATRVLADTTTGAAQRKPLPPRPIEEMNRVERMAFVRVLADSGYYRCCIDPNCTMCLDEGDGQCVCGDHARQKDPVCGECYRGWKRGKGSIKGVTSDDIRRQ